MEDSNVPNEGGETGGEGGGGGGGTAAATAPPAINGDDGYPRPPTAANATTERKGTISSACFNLLSTMVGGGSLTLPLAFSQAGNGLFAPVLLVVTAIFSEFCFRLLVACAPPPDPQRVGDTRLETVTKEAFGARAHFLSTALVFFMCYFGLLGYSVLLRDMLQPVSDEVFAFVEPSRWTRDLGMLAVVLLITPLCGLKTLTSLEKLGATSMLSVLILGSCVIYRSFQCASAAGGNWNIQFWPDSLHQVLNAVPIFISCFVCHFNVLPVHNDLQNPTPARVSLWLRSTTWTATAYYAAIGFSGSLYSACVPSGSLQGNILLDFDDHDPLLMVGRMCLALTIAIALPMLTLPARDILLEARTKLSEQFTAIPVEALDVESTSQLEEPLLLMDPTGPTQSQSSSSFGERMLVAISVTWTAAGVACCVPSVDIVWDFLGSSLSILLCYLIPCGSYLMLVKTNEERQSNGSTNNTCYSRALCWFLLILFIPMMFILTLNAALNTLSG